jgi:hypothetical protein
MIRNKAYFSVIGPQGPPGPGVVTPGSSIDSALVLWNGTNASTVKSSTVIVDEPSSGALTLTSDGNDVLQINSALLKIGSSQINVDISNIGYFRFSTGNTGFGSNFSNLTTADTCSLFGNRAGLNITSGSGNTGCGMQSLEAATTAVNCCALGYSAARRLVSSIETICIGIYSGFNYLSNESYNVCISSAGKTEDTGQIRIGSNVHTGCYIAGIYSSSHTNDHQPVYIDSNGKLHSLTSSSINTPMGEIYYENPITDTRTLSVGVAAQISVPNGTFYNTQFTSPTNGQLKFTGSYTRYAHVTATISCVIAAGTNQLLVFELRLNGSKIAGTGIQVKFADNTDYQIITLQKLTSITTNDILMGCPVISIVVIYLKYIEIT